MTTVTTLLTVGVGRSATGSLVVAAAVLSGQLSVGWSNDAHDAAADLRAERDDKPIVAGQVARRTVWVGAFVALVATVALSFVAAGPVGGAIHLAAVALAWIYNLGVARTRWSFVPYVLSFALLPTFVTYAGDPPGPPAGWAVVGFAAMGVGAHLVNGVRDLEVDRRSGLDGAAVRLGATRGRLLAASAFVVAGVAIGVGMREGLPALALIVPALLVGGLLPVVWIAPPRWAFRAVLLTAVGLVVVLVAATVAGGVSIAA